MVHETTSFAQQILFLCQVSSVAKGAEVPWKVALLARAFGQLSSFKEVASIIKVPKVVMPTGSDIPSAAKRWDMVTDSCLFYQADVRSLNTHKREQM